MNTHERFESLLGRFLDGDDPADATALAELLRDQPSLQPAYRAAIRQHILLRGQSRLEAGLQRPSARLISRRPTRRKPYQHPQRRRSFLIAGAGIIILLLAVVVGGNLSDNGNPPLEVTQQPHASTVPTPGTEISQAQDPIATLVTHQRASITRTKTDGDSEAASPIGDADLRNGDRIQVDHRGYAGLRFRDGSTMILAGNSTLVMGDPLDHGPHLEHGAAFIAVDKNQYRPWLFNLPLGKIEVIGTKFIVSADSDGNVCRVSEGEVVLHSPSQQAQVGAGQEARLTPDGHISVLLSPEPPQPRYRWRSPQGEHTLPAANATSLRLNDDNEWTASIPGQEYFVDGISLVLTFAPGPESGQVPLLTLTFRPYMYDFNVPTHLPHRDILIVSIHPDHVPVAQPGAADWENTIHELLEHFHQHRNADLHIPQRQRQLLEVAMFDRVLTSDEQLDLLIQHIHR